MTLLDDLREAAERRRAAEQAYEAATQALRDAIVTAHDNAVPVAAIARATGLTRPSVYNHLQAAGRM